MVLWRISNYASLDGIGGMYASGRWHTRGRPILYCTWAPSTALLETLVHMEIDAEDRPDRFKLLKIAFPDSSQIERFDPNSLPSGWEQEAEGSRGVGDRWLSEQRSLLLEVPSVLVPETWNVLVNPLHRQVSALKIDKVYEHQFDARFFR